MPLDEKQQVQVYRSRAPIYLKLLEAKAVLGQLLKFRGRFFARQGLDEVTGTKPVRVLFASFLTHTRSILQYAHREARKGGQTQAYEDEVSKRPIVKVFKYLRDSETHGYPPEVTEQMFTTAIVDFDPVTGVGRSRLFEIRIEALGTERPASPASDVRVEYHVTVRVEPTPALLAELKERGQHDLAEAASRGEPVCNLIEFEGVRDLFPLCERYVEALESFVQSGIARGFIT